MGDYHHFIVCGHKIEKKKTLGGNPHKPIPKSLDHEARK
jgi:hypothetical protein